MLTICSLTCIYNSEIHIKFKVHALLQNKHKFRKCHTHKPDSNSIISSKYTNVAQIITNFTQISEIKKFKPCHSKKHIYSAQINLDFHFFPPQTKRTWTLHRAQTKHIQLKLTQLPHISNIEQIKISTTSSNQLWTNYHLLLRMDQI